MFNYRIPASRVPLTDPSKELMTREWYRFFSQFSGHAFDMPYGSFYDTTTQLTGDNGVPYAMRLNTTDVSDGVSVQPRQVVATAGISATTLICTSITSGRFYPNMLLSGTGVTSGTAILVQLTSTESAAASPTRVSGGAGGSYTFVVSSVAGIEVRQFVTGTNLSTGTRVAAIDASTNTITLSKAFTATGASGTYSFRPWGYKGSYTVSISRTVPITTISGITYSKITVDRAGVYNLQFSAQFDRISPGTDDVSVWLSKNGENVSWSCTEVIISGTEATNPLVAAWNFFIRLDAGDYVELMWSSPNTSIEIQTVAERLTPSRPAVPSVILTMQYVSS